MTSFSDVQHDQAVVKCGTDTVSGEVTNHVVPEPICIGFDDAADDRQRTARFDGVDRSHRRLPGPLNQQLVLLGDIAGQKRGVGVTVHAVDVGGDVDVDDVAVLEGPVVRDPVANHLVNRRADRLGHRQCRGHCAGNQLRTNRTNRHTDQRICLNRVKHADADAATTGVVL